MITQKAIIPSPVDGSPHAAQSSALYMFHE
jgi:hypothetical protein